MTDDALPMSECVEVHDFHRLFTNANAVDSLPVQKPDDCWFEVQTCHCTVHPTVGIFRKKLDQR